MRMIRVVTFWIVATAATAIAGTKAGVSRIDVTPKTPIRLSGYAARTAETSQVEQPLFARALALGTGRDDAVVILTVDSIGLPASVCDSIAKRVAQNGGPPRDRLAMCSTHSHTAPHLDGLIPNLFGLDVPVDQSERITRYTEQVIEGGARAALEALDAMRETHLVFGSGRASFAANRRTKGGPVDHDVPTLVARDPDGALIAVLSAYACHCTTLAPKDDFVCGDWAGYAAERIEGMHAGAVALIAIGCAGDQNPIPRTGLDHAKAHGAALAAEIEELVASPSLARIGARPEAVMARITLPFATQRTRQEWETRRSQGGAIGHHAAYFLARLDRGETIETSLEYPVQAIRFGDELAMVFLAGEVVVDYALRLKSELRSDRLFLAAYSNDIPCYIPSRRVLEEGGYEAEDAMIYYGRPGRLAIEVEDLIVGAVRGVVGEAFLLTPSARPPQDGGR